MDQASEIREKIDIVSFISEYLPLKKAGRNFKANCPFHNEKSPSFMISPERQIWHCFGCQKGGDAFSFLMEYEKMEFPEALRILAKKAGVELKSFKFDNQLTSEKEKIYSLNRHALKFYQYVLLKHSLGKKALFYLKEKRHMPEKLIEAFSLGFSPNSGSALSNYLINKKGYKKQDLYLAGLAFETGGRTVDFFRGRVMFPLSDHRGNIVGFSARILDEKTDTSKYINTKETSIYHKGSLFFGLDIAKEEIKNKEQAILVEGEFDVISCFKEGIRNVVAIKGTALTENQVNLLSRFTPKITLCLDMDEAGFEATKRSLPLIEKKGLTTTIIIPDGKDPDEAIQKNPDAFKKALKDDIGIYDFLIAKFLSLYDKTSSQGKGKIVEEMKPLLSAVENEVVKEHYIKKLSKEIDTSIESIAKEIDKYQSGKKSEKVAVVTSDKRKRRELLEEYLIALIVQSEDLILALEKVNDILKDYKFEIPSYQKIMDFMTASIKHEAKIDGKKISNGLPTELVKSFDSCYLFPLPSFKSESKYLEDLEKVANELSEINTREKKKLMSKN
ncbi:MAG: DNA primase [Patescibacteria group bacterium]|nr:DNA primase [Patescibacteria group bacterium]